MKLIDNTHPLQRVFLACIFSCIAPFSTADINFNGFATVAGGLTLADDQQLHNYDDKFLFEENSFIGLQANTDLGGGLTAVAQIVSRGKDSWTPKFEWAYLGYEINENVKVLVGRQRMPFYVYSDYLDVGYAYHWITPPEAVYSVPFNSTTGIGTLINNQIGNIDSTVHIVYGRNTEKLFIAGQENDSDVNNMFSAAWSLTYDSLTFRAGFTSADLNIDFTAVQPLSDGWAQAGAGMSQQTGDPSFGEDWAGFSQHILANNGDDKGDFSGFGVTYDNGDILAVSEYTVSHTEGTIIHSEESGYYLSFGKRFGNFMPHVTYGERETIPTDPTFLDAVPQGLDPGIDGLIATTEAVFASTAQEQTYFIVGLRWDFHPSAAFKVDYKSQTDSLPVDKTNNLLRFSLATVF